MDLSGDFKLFLVYNLICGGFGFQGLLVVERDVFCELFHGEGVGMRIVLRLLALVMMIAFIGCATAPASGPAPSGSSGGLSDAQLEKMCGKCGGGN